MKKSISCIAISLMFILGFCVTPLVLIGAERLNEGQVTITEVVAYPITQISIDDNLFTVDVASVAIAHMYSIMSLSTGSDIHYIRRGLFPFIDGFQIESIIRITNSTYDIAYAVNFKSKNGAYAYVIVGTDSHMPPIIEFSLWDKFEGHYVPLGWWYRSRMHNNEITEEMVQVIDWGPEFNLPSATPMPPPATPRPTSYQPRIYESSSEWFEPWLIIIDKVSKTDMLRFMESPISNLSNEAVIKIHSSLVQPLQDVPNVHNVLFRTMSFYSQHWGLGLGLRNHCAPTVAMNLTLYYHASGRVPGIFTGLPGMNELARITVLYRNMNTNFITPGVWPWDFVNGLRTTFTQMSRLHGWNVFETVNDWSTYRHMIRNNFPVPLLFWRDNWVWDNPVNVDWSWHWILGVGYFEATLSGINFISAADGWFNTNVMEWCNIINRNILRNRIRFRSVSTGNNPPADRQIFVNVGWFN